MPSYTLYYFPIKGLGEGLRLILTAGGAEWTDKQVTFDDWKGLKESMPMGQMPVLEVDGKKKLSQSHAIAAYLGEVLGLQPADPWERAKAHELVASFTDNGPKMASIMQHKEDKAKAKAAYDEVMSTFVEPRMALYDKILAGSSSGYLLSQFCWADLMFYNYFNAFRHFYGVDLGKFPAITAFMAKIEAHEKVKDFIAQRKEIPVAPMSAVGLTQ